MKNNRHNPDNEHDKGNQMVRVFEAFKEYPKTMLMVEMETGIMRSNITWYVDEWREHNLIFEIRKGICPITRHSNVGFYSTDQSLFPKSPQLSFDY